MTCELPAITEVIDICICTFRRDSLVATLESLAAQQLPAGVSLRVIVADNDTTDSRKSKIESVGQTLHLSLTYVHAPERNISVARNACLTAARHDWLAFIDDDEVARPDWVAQLLAARNGRQVVFGQVQATFPDPATPDWVKQGDYHSNRIEARDAAWNGYTSNVLIDRQFIALHQLRFAEPLGQIGGEDTMFFFEAHQAGAAFGYAPAALVDEPAPLNRTSMRWLILRRFRSGQIHYMLLQRQKQVAFGVFGSAAKAAVCAGMAVLCVASPTRRARNIIRAVLHLGVVASAIGFAPYREYGGNSKKT